MRRGASLICLALTAVAVLACIEAMALWVRPVEEPAAAILEEIPEGPGLNNVTLTADGSRAAASVVEQLKESKFRGTIQFYPAGTDEPAQITFPAEVRDLLFAPGGESLFALLNNPAKKRLGDTDLVRIDTASGKTQKRLRMPPSAVGLAYWPAGNALLVVCAHEIRSVLLPDMRSGPLYRLIGVNTSAAILDGAGLLVGRDDGLSLIDLRDPPGEDQMPVRLRIESNGPVVQVATNRDGSEILIRWLDGGIASVDLTAPGLVPQVGDGVLPVRPWPQRESVPGLPPEFDPAPPIPIEEPTTPEPELESAPAAAEVGAAAALAPSDAPGGTATTPVADTAAAEREAEETASPPPPAPKEHDGPAPQLAGKLTGPGAKTVSAVVLFGPDNILREATRITPDSDGGWQVAGLPPGRYRVQLAGNGDQVPVSDPPFHVVEVQPDRPTAEASFQVLESR